MLVAFCVFFRSGDIGLCHRGAMLKDPLSLFNFHNLLSIYNATSLKYSIEYGN